jgi:hypothetical protein
MRPYTLDRGGGRYAAAERGARSFVGAFIELLTSDREWISLKIFL